MFGRFNPPTAAHEKLLDEAAKIAGKGQYRIYASKSEDVKNNPVCFTEKVKYIRKMFPRHARAVMSDADIGTPLTMCSKLYEQGFTKVTLIVGQDKLAETSALMSNYNGRPLMEGGFFNFQNGVRVISSGDVDPDISASRKLCESAVANNLELFSKGLPAAFNESKELFNAVRAGMGLKESKSFRKHIQLESVSPIREAYINQEIFAVGDEVVIKESQEVGKIAHRGSNYLIVSMHDGRKVRKWLNGVELLEKKVPEVIELDSKIVIERNTSIPGKSISKLRSISK